MGRNRNGRKEQSNLLHQIALMTTEEHPFKKPNKFTTSHRVGSKPVFLLITPIGLKS